MKRIKAFWLVLCMAVAIGVAANIVRAQLVFPDGTQQTTAFRSVRVPAGAAFAEVVVVGTSIALVSIGDPIPPGKELVILQVRLPLATGIPSHFSLESRLPSPNQGTGPINLAYASSPNSSGIVTALPPEAVIFPDGTVTVGEGRQLWLQFRGRTFDPVFTQMSFAVSVLGYFRNN